MPTAARLVAAICLAVVAWFASEAVKQLFPEGTNFGSFDTVNVSIGLLIGWFVLGARSGRGYASGISNGFTSVIALTFWALFVQATYEMVNRSFRRFYDSPFEAIGSIFEIGMDYGLKMLDPTVIVTLLIGGIVSGLVAEVAGQRWK
ncbi:TrgA family protein [Sagittula stellata]|uniref:Tellurite resistance protein n=1 Tax=Sagittula stellata (strain ATCC 700073 / DSM 11524 / E-37) TaxID=388399 RepID=A3K6L2_SAGS3|nr:TrgA family protein [Sagittula stellata]EBA07362.1 tellurite resistance protein [Sagittula stellata E-37]